MTKLVWDQSGGRVYESGIDRGVLYFPEGGGVAWNGLSAVEPEFKNSVEPVYFDGIKVNDLVTVGDFKGILRAYTYPNEFLIYEGLDEDKTGYFVTGQVPKFFHLSYRSGLGNDVSDSIGYKIHLLWNLTAVASTKAYTTLSMETTPSEFEWDLTSVPEALYGYRPSSYLVIDTRTASSAAITALELILYGTTGVNPRIPSIQQVLAM